MFNQVKTPTSQQEFIRRIGIIKLHFGFATQTLTFCDVGGHREGRKAFKRLQRRAVSQVEGIFAEWVTLCDSVALLLH